MIVFLGALSLSSLLLYNVDARSKVQSVITSILAVKLSNESKPPDDGEIFKVSHELDVAVENFFKRIIETFINSWYSTITQDESFAWDIKVQITQAIREIARRVNNVS